jgi:hypothetical protein
VREVGAGTDGAEGVGRELLPGLCPCIEQALVVPVRSIAQVVVTFPQNLVPAELHPSSCIRRIKVTGRSHY